MKRKPTRPEEPPAYLNLRGEPIDLVALRRMLLSRPDEHDETARKPTAQPGAKAPRAARVRKLGSGGSGECRP